MKKKTPVLQINPNLIDGSFLNDSLKNAPKYNKKYKSAIERIIKCIHGLDDFHKKASREQLEIYIGRATKSTLKNRWKQHSTIKRHAYGVVLFTCGHEWVADLEMVGIKILKKLKEKGMLCVKDIKNQTSSKRGKKPRKEDAIVYMTWKISPESNEWTKPSKNDISNIADEIYYELDKEIGVTKKQLHEGLQPLKSLTKLDGLTYYYE
jgi:hypothetical protein